MCDAEAVEMSGAGLEVSPGTAMLRKPNIEVAAAPSGCSRRAIMTPSMGVKPMPRTTPSGSGHSSSTVRSNTDAYQRRLWTRLLTGIFTDRTRSAGRPSGDDLLATVVM